MLDALLALEKIPEKLFALSDSCTFIAQASRAGFVVVDVPTDPGFNVTDWANKLGISERMPKKFGGTSEKHLLIRI